MDTVEMRRYTSAKWKFAIDVPKRWNSFPPVHTNSLWEVIRFASREQGTHLLIIFRKPHDPKQAPKDRLDAVEKALVKQGFERFSRKATTIGPHEVMTLEFERLQENGLWSCREYFLDEGTLEYVLGFGTNRREELFEMYDRMAKSFEILPE